MKNGTHLRKWVGMYGLTNYSYYPNTNMIRHLAWEAFGPNQSDAKRHCGVPICG